MSNPSIQSSSSRPVAQVGEDIRPEEFAQDWHSKTDDVEACRSEANTNIEHNNLSSVMDYSEYSRGEYLDDQIVEDRCIDEVRDRRHVDSEIFPLKGNANVDTYMENPNSSIESGGETLISRQWYFVLPSSLALYVIVQCVISRNATECRLVEPYAPWTQTAAVAVLSCYGVSVIYYIANGISVDCWAQRECQHLRGVYASAATICTIACAATALYTTPLGGYICRDALKVDTPQGQWAEWLIASPLLGYVAIAIEDKPHLTVEDVIILILMFLSIALAFATNFTKSFAVASGLIVGSSFCLIGNLVMALKATQSMDKSIAVMDRSLKWAAERTLMKIKLSWLLLLVMPIFPVVYFLNMFRIINRDQAVVANLLCGLLLKMVLVSALSLESVILQLASEKKISENRKEFLRYVFHEVRVPLSTITMGISILKDDITEAQKDVITMMDSAAGHMSDTLSDVLSMSKIEDGDLTLVLKPFKLQGLLDFVVSATTTKAQEKGVRLLRDESRAALPPEPLYLIGDEAKLKRVLLTFLANAINFSHPGSDVVLSVKNAQKCSFVASVSSSFAASVSGKRQHPRHGVGAGGIGVGAVRRIRVSPRPVTRNRWSQDLKNLSMSNIRQKMSDLGTKTPTRPLLITICVTDKGTGVPRDVQDKLFHAFAQIRPHDKEGDGRGSGLGLVVAKRIITLHGGDIVFESELGRGSTFGLCIPFLTTDRAYMSGRFPALESLASSIKSVAVNALYHPHQLRSSSSKTAIRGESPSKMNRKIDELDSCVRRKINSIVPLVSSSHMNDSMSVSVKVAREKETLMTERDLRAIEVGEFVQIRSVTGQLMYGQLVRTQGIPSSLLSTAHLSTHSIPASGSESSFQERRLRFLLVDDTASNCKMLKMLLNRKGIESDIANNGLEAVNVYKVPCTDTGARRAAVYDVIFMDHTMPIMNGVDATRAIRSLGFTGLIIGLTGNALDDDVASFIHAGADCVTLKPFRSEHLTLLLGFIAEFGCESNPRIRNVMKIRPGKL